MRYQVVSAGFVLRLERGEAVIESLTKFAHHHHLPGGFFVGLGAVREVELAHYSVDNKQYSTQTFTDSLELTNLTGNIALLGSDTIVHAHATCSKPDMSVVAGHLVKATVSGTLEVMLWTLPPMTKTLDDVTGLKLLDLPEVV